MSWRAADRSESCQTKCCFLFLPDLFFFLFFFFSSTGWLAGWRTRGSVCKLSAAEEPLVCARAPVTSQRDERGNLILLSGRLKCLVGRLELARGRIGGSVSLDAPSASSGRQERADTSDRNFSRQPASDQLTRQTNRRTDGQTDRQTVGRTRKHNSLGSAPRQSRLREQH